jgi:hypothetical protein
MTEQPEHANQTNGAPGEALAVCDDVRGVLFEYMTHELGDARSRFVREHLRRCAACRAEAAEIKTTLAALHAADALVAASPDRLSADHRKRLLRAVMHPVRDWIGIHHRLVALVMAAVVLLAVLFAVRNVALFQIEETGPRIPIWKIFKSGGLPELVERERQRALAEAAAADANDAQPSSSKQAP